MLSDIVFYLINKGAHLEPKKITTLEIAKAIGASQQTASRKIIALERSGEIERQNGKLLLTKKAVASAREFAKSIIRSLDGPRISFEGAVVTGLKEGAYYLSQPQYIKQIKKKLGFAPFPGTLNISIEPDGIEKRILLRETKGTEISGFKKGNRTFGKIEAYRCVIFSIPGAIVFPERSIHGLHVLEIISSFNLRKKLSLSDGSMVRVEVI